MPENALESIDVALLRIGIHVVLDLNWIAHPFPRGAFKISSPEQIATIRSLGLKSVRYDPAKSDPPPGGAPTGAAPTGSEPAVPGVDPGKAPVQALAARQRASLKKCERRFDQATRAFRKIVDSARGPAGREQSESLVRGMVGELSGAGDVSIRLLSEQVGERSAQHSVNVAVISLLLAKACGFADERMAEIGLGALLHDIGKIELPDRLRWRDEQFSSAELAIFREHVAHGVRLGKAMGLPEGALRIIGQHHEYADGSGYPQQIRGETFPAAARIVSLVNHYDRLCNPPQPAAALTPHEALSQIFTQMTAQFGAPILASFIRMMGVYPPGSAVELVDGRHALVVSVNSTRPLKPSIVIHDPAVPRDDALIVDLEQRPEIGIRRSLKPRQLPRSALDALMPRVRNCYFFEAVGAPDEFGAEA